MSTHPSHFGRVIGTVRALEQLYPEGIAVDIIPPLMPRLDGDEIFKEGASFSGLERWGSNVESCITPTAAPHIRPKLPLTNLVGAAEQVLEHPVGLSPAMADIATVSPQLLVWWRNTEAEDGLADILHLASMPTETQEAFCSGVAAQASRAARIITQAAHTPVIWGSWGFGTPQERVLSGRGRGVPTNRHGHLHVIDFDLGSPEETIVGPLSATERLNHYKPWGTLFHEQFGSAFARVVSRVFTKADLTNNTAPFSEVLRDQQGSIRNVNEGYAIGLLEATPFASVLKALVATAGQLESFYDRSTRNHADFYRRQSSPGAAESALQGIVNDALDIGLTAEESQCLADFVVGIRPTYTQICTWLAEAKLATNSAPEDIAQLSQQKDLYERVSRYLDRKTGEKSMFGALLQDTVSTVEDYGGSRSIWPEHAAATYVIDDYSIVDGTIMVRGLRIIPGIDSTESAPERITGRTLRRPSGPISTSRTSSHN